jgi:hypothetical protein
MSQEELHPNETSFSHDLWVTKECARLQARNEALELVATFAQDVVDFWPLMTIRTIRLMIPKMAALKEALELLRGQNRS